MEVAIAGALEAGRHGLELLFAAHHLPHLHPPISCQLVALSLRFLFCKTKDHAPPCWGFRQKLWIKVSNRREAPCWAALPIVIAGVKRIEKGWNRQGGGEKRRLWIYKSLIDWHRKDLPGSHPQADELVVKTGYKTWNFSHSECSSGCQGGGRCCPFLARKGKEG